MKTLQVLLGAAALVAANASNAAVLNFDYRFDGSTLAASAGYGDLFGTSLAVGDTLNLTYRAVGANSYWKMSGVGQAGNVNLGFSYPASCGTRSTSGSYTASLNGATVLTDSYASAGQSCIHAGPEQINFGSVGDIDVFSISYTLNASDASANVIESFGDTWWQVWELFSTRAEFVYVADANPPSDVPEPAVPALMLAGVAALAFAKRRRA